MTAERMRSLEQPFLDDGVPLMQRAAAAVAEAARSFDGDVLVVVGPGNNGGDGLFAAAELAAERRVLLWLAAGWRTWQGLRAAKVSVRVVWKDSPGLAASASSPLGRSTASTGTSRSRAARAKRATSSGRPGRAPMPVKASTTTPTSSSARVAQAASTSSQPAALTASSPDA